MYNKRFISLLIVFLLIANFIVIFHSVRQHAHAEWVQDGAFSLAEPDGCWCPKKGFFCYCWHKPPVG